MSKSIHATIRIKSADHNLSLQIEFRKESSLSEKFDRIFETISRNDYLTGKRLESIYFYETEEIKCTE